MTFKFCCNVQKSLCYSTLNLHPLRPEPILAECRTFWITIFKCHNTSPWLCTERLLKSFGTFWYIAMGIHSVPTFGSSVTASGRPFISFKLHQFLYTISNGISQGVWLLNLWSNKNIVFAHYQLFIRSRHKFIRRINSNEDTITLGDINKMPGDDAISLRSYFSH